MPDGSMIPYLHYQWFIILLGLVSNTQAHLVSNLFYYHEKEQRCNCEFSQQCSPNGACSPDKCASPYIGVNCQHASLDLSLLPNYKNVQPSLLDGDDTTCLKQNWTGVAVYEIVKPIHFIWIYISSNSSIEVKPRLVLYKEGVNLNVESYVLRINDNSLLVKLRDDVMYTKLELSNLPEDSCSLEVSLGRNLAMSSSPSQSTVHPSAAYAEHAIQGIDGNEGTCVRTKTGFSWPPEWWRTRLRYDARVNWVVLVIDKVYRCRMRSFVFKMFASNTSEVFTRSHRKVPHQISIHAAVDAMIREIEVSIRSTSTTSSMKRCVIHSSINLCEIYVYGEFRCPDNMYGVLCERHCPFGCTRDSCDPDWACPAGCNDDRIGEWCDTDCRFRHGPNCEFACSDGCSDSGKCDRISGDCLDGCNPGYYPSDCTKPCQPGTFGINCTKFCLNCAKDSATDAYACDSVSGECSLGCAEGFSGDDCHRIIVHERNIYYVVKRIILFLLSAIFLILSYKAFPWKDTNNPPVYTLTSAQ